MCLSVIQAGSDGRWVEVEAESLAYCRSLCLRVVRTQNATVSVHGFGQQCVRRIAVASCPQVEGEVGGAAKS